VCSVAGWPAVISRLKESSGREIVQQSTHVFRRRLQSSNFVLSLPFVLPLANLTFRSLLIRQLLGPP